ncbi:hypothetical protein F2981_12565 [Sinorhizobium meliloti]|nr:hypothetical protein [Sinorhizobium meliloti]
MFGDLRAIPTPRHGQGDSGAVKGLIENSYIALDRTQAATFDSAQPVVVFLAVVFGAAERRILAVIRRSQAIRDCLRAGRADGKIQFDEHHMDLRCGKPRISNEIVDLDWGRPESLDDARRSVSSGAGGGRSRFLDNSVPSGPSREKRSSRLRGASAFDVRRRGRDGRALFQEIVRAVTARIERRPGHGKDQPAEIAA